MHYCRGGESKVSSRALLHLEEKSESLGLKEKGVQDAAKIEVNTSAEM